jgi:hypothetical protein
VCCSVTAVPTDIPVYHEKLALSHLIVWVKNISWGADAVYSERKVFTHNSLAVIGHNSLSLSQCVGTVRHSVYVNSSFTTFYIPIMQSNIFTKTFKITCFSGNKHLHINVLFKSVEEFVRAQTVEKKVPILSEDIPTTCFLCNTRSIF